MTTLLSSEKVAIADQRNGDPPVPRSVLGSLSLGLAVLCFLQAPGRIVADTKLDIAISPLTFLSHALYLWSPQQEFGGVPFQAYGYFFPMGPFFVLGHALDIPTWVIQRLWVAGLLSMGLWGIVRLAEALGVGSRASRVVAGLAFVFLPPATLLGSTSWYLLAFNMLPWVIVPLLRGAQRGSTRVGAARSGVALLLMGGINAAAVIAILPLPLLWFLTRTPGKRRRQLLAWWVLAACLACVWWGVSLLLEARYGFNLIPFTESSATTTATTSAFDVLRGNSYWLAYDQIGPTAIRSGWEAVTSPGMILAGGALGALGLFGLAQRRMKERIWLISALGLGVVLVGSGYPGTLGAPFSGTVQDLLSGPLALLRNVWKFQPLINLALALGIAHAVHILAGSLRRRVADRPARPRQVLTRGRFVVIPLALVAVAGIALPFLTDDFFPAESFPSVPLYWQSAASWLNDHAGTTTSLVVPGSSVGTYTWGYPLDEPMQWLSTANWAIRGQDPDGSVGSIETLDAVEQVIASGIPNSGLAAFLSQVGVHYVVERNDLSPLAGAPTPLQVHVNLSTTAGLRRVASFGPRLKVPFGLVHLRIPSVEIYAVRPTVRTVVVAPVSNSVVVSGGAQGLLALDQVGLDPGNRAVLLAGDGGVRASGQTWVDTDTSPRVGVSYGYSRNNATYVLARGQVSPLTGKPPQDETIVPGQQHQTVAAFLGARDVTASSFGSTYLTVSPEDQPAAALDGDLATSWVASANNDSVGQWLRVDFDRPVDIAGLGIQLLASAEVPRVTQVAVTTANGTLRQRVHPEGKPQLLRAPAGRTMWIRVTFTKVLPAQRILGFPSGAGIRELTIPGVTVRKAEAVPADELQRFAGIGARAPVYVFTAPSINTTGLNQPGDDPEPQMLRLFSTPRPETFVVSGTLTPRPGVTSAALLQYLDHSRVGPTSFRLACGQGPTLKVDGTTLPTQATGTYNFLGFQQMKFATCGLGASLHLPTGTHVLKGNVGGLLKVAAVSLSPSRGSPYAPATTVARAVTVHNWGVEDRTITVGRGPASYLVVRQNFNNGWTAQLAGRTLTPVRVNGWQQAWVVPKGSGGLVMLTFGPDRLYQLGLVGGAVLAVVLLGLALWPARKVNDAKARGARHSLPLWGVLIGGTAALVVLGGVVALALPLLLLVAWITRSGRWLPALAGLSYLAAGIVVAVHVGPYPASGVGTFGWPAQALSLLALAAVFGSLAVDGTQWRRRRTQPLPALDASGGHPDTSEHDARPLGAAQREDERLARHPA